MGVVTDSTLKTYFNRGDQPTEAQFADLIDSKFSKSDDRRSVDSVTALKALDTSVYSDGDELYLKAYYDGVDGGQGFVTYDSSLSSFDDGLTFEADDGNGGWKRKYNFIFVEYFGCVNDTTTTNRNTGLSNAISSVSSTNEALFVADGDKTFSQSFTIDAAFKLYGLGRRTTRLIRDGDGDLFVASGPDAANAFYGIEFANLAIRNENGTSTTTGDGFNFTYCPTAEFRNVDIFGFYNGISNVAGWRTKLINCRIQNTANNGYYQSNNVAGDQSQACVINASEFTGGAGNAIESVSCDALCIYGGDIEGHTNSGVLLDGGDNCLVEGTWFENNDGDSVLIDIVNGAGGNRHTIRNTSIFNESGDGYGINVNQSSITIIENIAGIINGTGGIRVGSAGSIREINVFPTTANDLRTQISGGGWSFDHKTLGFLDSIDATGPNALAHGLGITPARVIFISENGESVGQDPNRANDDTNIYAVSPSGNGKATIIAI